MTRHLGDLEATKELAELCHIDRGKYILDVGCGIGRTPCYLAKTYACRVVGVDISEKMISWATQRGKSEGVTNLTEFKVADVFAILTRVTKPGGYIGLNESSWIKTPAPEEVVQFLSGLSGAGLVSVDAIEAELVKLGLKDIRVNVHRTTARGDVTSRLRYYGPKRRPSKPISDIVLIHVKSCLPKDIERNIGRAVEGPEGSIRILRVWSICRNKAALIERVRKPTNHIVPM